MSNATEFACSLPAGRPAGIGSSSTAWLANRKACAASAQWRRSLSSNGAGSGGGGEGDSSSTVGGSEPTQLARNVGEIEVALTKLAEQYSLSNMASLIASVAALNLLRQQRVLRNGSGVARHLASLGLGPPQLEALLLRCPYLFSRPAKEQAAVLFGQLQQLGLTPAEAAKCFERQPAAAHWPSFTGIAMLLKLLKGSGQQGQTTSRPAVPPTAEESSSNHAALVQHGDPAMAHSNPAAEQRAERSTAGCGTALQLEHPCKEQ